MEGRKGRGRNLREGRGRERRGKRQGERGEEDKDEDGARKGRRSYDRGCSWGLIRQRGHSPKGSFAKGVIRLGGHSPEGSSPAKRGGNEFRCVDVCPQVRRPEAVVLTVTFMQMFGSRILGRLRCQFSKLFTQREHMGREGSGRGRGAEGGRRGEWGMIYISVNKGKWGLYISLFTVVCVPMKCAFRF